mmetsp:Transcript_12198/g.29806  ORF Transcript_12198/g.29806 Transcript_12198/m.29806 type:complete len:172 (+) Transcript_12198:318-833(+)
MRSLRPPAAIAHCRVRCNFSRQAGTNPSEAGGAQSQTGRASVNGTFLNFFCHGPPPVGRPRPICLKLKQCVIAVIEKDFFSVMQSLCPQHNQESTSQTNVDGAPFPVRPLCSLCKRIFASHIEDQLGKMGKARYRRPRFDWFKNRSIHTSKPSIMSSSGIDSDCIPPPHIH